MLTAWRIFKYSEYCIKRGNIMCVNGTTTIRFSTAIEEHERVFVKFARTIQNRTFTMKINGRINHVLKKGKKQQYKRDENDDASCTV